ncbi:YgaB-like protein [Anoxybacillus vitaminiphilus]|uniref:YgaB-like protein n=1 Tax=Paranoxybacillus vitaminiphilus TaxID=581036 RepID=A0A327Y465_9BACL|nr:YgaB family protein [Anoxybacillus vitaminiphilus]RAK15544.1 YgaB-like protein [Anoxybacillus vitaminiphilus]
MEQFERLVREQLKTMDQLLFLQEELERCQAIEEELIKLQNKTKLRSIQDEISAMKKQLREIQQIFEKQTEEVIQSYQRAQHKFDGAGRKVSNLTRNP